MLSIDKYRNLIKKIDQYSQEWSSSPPIPLSCRPGCDECCRAKFTLFAVEVAAITQSLGERGLLGGIKAKKRNNGSCPFLVESRCLIYDERPILCRTQGYPLLYHDEDGRQTSDICSRNRTRGEISLPARYVLNLDTLNRCLSSLNYLFLAEMEEQGSIVPARQDIINILEDPAGAKER